MNEKNPFRLEVGNEVRCFRKPSIYKIEKIAGEFIRLEGIGVRHIDSVVHHDSPYFISRKLIKTIRDFKLFVDEIPSAISSASVLEVESHYKALFKVFDFCVGTKGLKKLKNAIYDALRCQNNLNSPLLFIDDDNHKNYLLIHLEGNVKRSLIKLELEYIPTGKPETIAQLFRKNLLTKT